MQHKVSFLIHIAIEFTHELGWRVQWAIRYILNHVLALSLLRIFFILFYDINNGWVNFVFILPSHI